MWKSGAEGRILHFHLAGINNQNFIMRDEETGSWWQQVTGCAILGPLTGRCLQAIPWDEVTFAVFKREHPRGLVLLPDAGSKDDYAEADWEKNVADYPTVTPIDPHDTLKPRDLVVGVTSGANATAYPWTTLAAQNPILDSVGGTPVHNAILMFDCLLGRPPAGAGEGVSLAVQGGLNFHQKVSGETLLIRLKDFWFDWKTYNPGTRVFMAGLAAPGR